MAKATSSPFSVKPLFQCLFTGVVFLCYILQFSQQIYWTTQVPFDQLQMNYLITSVGLYMVLPLVLFAIAYWVVRKTPGLWQRLFAASFIAVFGAIIAMITTQASLWIYQGITITGSGYNSFLAYEVAGQAVGVTLYLVALWQLRRRQAI